ncbi:hypothetical protein DDB_G0269092 [Dictyostelium discoideum AX4]|uniref:Uncharacterized protein n=1 Tax=Dictyostelium discoideum TaxID=44689 RepID=Q55EM3_DICDI|nr:hypothetical protein DDB_G0269092 [Dictyostelium discoideum AX4]EAL73135.1 hypothetical protein DDB_G0269092 [Dictyostelium discoideum AX4]|eukprot:XP_646997.1 hypothetical protein DDB_G0269092 [Dictyostelium discoideum AX4]
MNKNNKLILLFTIVLLSISYSLAAIVSQQGGDIPNGVNSNNKNKKDLASAADQLKYSIIFRNMNGTIANKGSVRIDMQSSFTSNGPVWLDLKAQLNGVKGNSTIAHVIVDGNTITGIGAEQVSVTNITIVAMMNSYASGKTCNVFENGL